ncbi:ArdC family protein [Gimesia chilikensis]|uniref:ArdC-like ssDNA-binding domain-containing protein n=1 Tax=Gimesia TaxID=1649453 RepID=UPI0011AABC85
MPSQTELRQQITNEIIKTLQQGIAPWKQPWSSAPMLRQADKRYHKYILRTDLCARKYAIRERSGSWQVSRT